MTQAYAAELKIYARWQLPRAELLTAPEALFDYVGRHCFWTVDAEAPKRLHEFMQGGTHLAQALSQGVEG